MPRRGSKERRRSPATAAPAAALSLMALVAAACGLDLTGTNDATFDAGLAAQDGAIDGPGAVSVSEGDATGGGAEDASADTAPPPPADARVPDAARSDACADGGCGALQTCKQWLAVLPPPATDGTYTVDPDGAGPRPAIPVFCNMTRDGGGWTLVGRELVSGQGQFRFLATDSGNPPGIANGTQSGLIGARFVGQYTDVWIDWSTTNFVRFTRPVTFDLFANVVNTSVPVSQFSTSETNLSGWVTTANGAKLCVASHDSDVRPGDTSWAILPITDNNTGCGCDSSGWRGQGAYYGGAPNGNQTTCTGFGGGWAGTKDDTIAKGGIVPNYETRIWIR